MVGGGLGDELSCEKSGYRNRYEERMGWRGLSFVPVVAVRGEHYNYKS